MVLPFKQMQVEITQQITFICNMFYVLVLLVMLSFFKIVSGILFTTPSDVQQSLHLPENTTYNSWYVNSKGLVHPKMNIKSICNMQNGNVFLYFNLHFTIHMRKV